MKKTFVLGDPHGGAKALQQVLKKSPFDAQKNRLVCIGDVCDGWSEIPETFDILMEIPDLVYLWGNHDMWSFQGFNQPDFIKTRHGRSWLSQGGQSTMDAYKRVGEEKATEHLKEFLPNKAKNWYVDDQGNAFMHAGFNLLQPLEDQQNKAEYFWNRDLFYGMHNSEDIHIKSELDINRIFVGHTPTINHQSSTEPIQYPANGGDIEIHFIDTGACYTGPLTLMDVESGAYWQSDPVMEIYPDQKGRNRMSYNDPGNPHNNSNE